MKNILMKSAGHVQKIVVILIVFHLAQAQTASAQLPALRQKYVTREESAPTEAKTQLATERKIIIQRGYNFNVGYTSVSLQPIQKITGDLEPSATEVARVKQIVTTRQLSEEGKNILKAANCVSSSKIYDPRNSQKLTVIRDQKKFGTCWAFAAIGAYEASYIRVNGVRPNIDCSEQFVVNCCAYGGRLNEDCGDHINGGYSYRVFDWLVDENKNLEGESSLAYSGPEGSCLKTIPATKYFATDWGIVDPSGDIKKIPSVGEIKTAICKYGAVTGSMLATEMFKDYTNGVFKEKESDYSNPESNHAVVIVGWDDTKNAWLIKNSWGTDWGEDGYGWIDYKSNNIGRKAAWVLAKKITTNESRQ